MKSVFQFIGSRFRSPAIRGLVVLFTMVGMFVVTAVIGCGFMAGILFAKGCSKQFGVEIEGAERIRIDAEGSIRP